MLNIAYGLLLAMLPVALWVGRVHDGAAKTSSRPSPTAKSASSTVPDHKLPITNLKHLRTIHPCAQVRRATSGEPATRINRIRAKRAQRRCDQWELRAWLQITAYPL
jgi:hypothetical protein